MLNDCWQTMKRNEIKHNRRQAVIIMMKSNNNICGGIYRRVIYEHLGALFNLMLSRKLINVDPVEMADHRYGFTNC